MQARTSTDPHILPDVIKPGLDVVFCGTAPGVVSARAAAYYAKPGNKFWRVLHEIGLTPRQLAPAEYLRLPDLGIGLTDLCKISYGQDKDLPREHLDRDALQQKMIRFQLRVLAFTSLQGAKWYFNDNKIKSGLQTATIGATRIFALPSTSGLATNHWDIGPWQHLAKFLRDK